MKKIAKSIKTINKPKKNKKKLRNLVAFYTTKFALFSSL